jgi:hypothetical protein
MNPYLKYVSICCCCILWFGYLSCRSHQPLPLEKATITAPLYKWPSDAPTQYRCYVDGKWGLKTLHLSGLLYIQPQGNDYLIVFTNEMGVKILEMFVWSDGRFETRKAMASINKPAVLELLAKDFNLLLGLGYAHCQSFQYHNQPVNVCNMLGDELRHYWTNKVCEKIELWNGKKGVVLIQRKGAETPSNSASILIQNVKARLNIQLNPLEAIGNE